MSGKRVAGRDRHRSDLDLRVKRLAEPGEQREPAEILARRRKRRKEERSRGGAQDEVEGATRWVHLGRD
jgi:uncharacterized membrane protein